MAQCPHIADGYLAMWGPLPCYECPGHVDSDRTIMSADVARTRYPQHAANIAANEVQFRQIRQSRGEEKAPKAVPVRKKDYATRKEYKWAKKNEARDTRSERVGIAILCVGLGYVTRSFVVFLIALVVLSVTWAIVRD